MLALITYVDRSIQIQQCIDAMGIENLLPPEVICVIVCRHAVGAP